jgi:hypothetical protein
MKNYAVSKTALLQVSQFVKGVKAIPAENKAMYTLLLSMALRLLILVTMLIRHCYAFL